MSSVREIAEACNGLIDDSQAYIDKSPMLLEKCKVVRQAVDKMTTVMDSEVDETYFQRVEEVKKACELEGMQLEQILSSKNANAKASYAYRRQAVEAYKTLELAIKRLPRTTDQYIEAMVDLRFLLDKYMDSRNLIYTVGSDEKLKVTALLSKYKEIVA